jgi:hypothetical protein
LAASGFRAKARAALTDVILGLCAATLALIGAGFLLLTGYWALARELGAIPAAGLIGLGLLFLAAIVLFILRERHIPAKPVPQPAPLTDPEPAVGDPAVIGVFVLGFVLARHFMQRR